MRYVTFLLVIFALTTLIACKEDTITPPQFNNTPVGVLELLETSFNMRDILNLDRVLSTDFVFYFNVEDVGKDVDGFEIPESWNRDDFMRACRNMFEQVYEIDFNIYTSHVDDPEEGVPTFEANDVQIKIIVFIDATNAYLAEGFCDFKFTNDYSGGYDNWKVSNWYDRTSWVFSLGYILALYY